MRTTLLAVGLAASLLGCTRPDVVPKSSGSVALSPDDALLFVADADHDVLTVIDVKTQAVLTQTPVGKAPERVAVATNGDVYVTSKGARTVSRLSPDGRHVEATATVGAEPVGLSLSKDGKELFVANSMSGTVTRLDATTLGVKTELAVGGQPWSVSPLADGKTLYVTDFAGGSVKVLSLESGAVTSTVTLEQSPASECAWGIAPIRQAAQATDVIVSPDGERAYVANVQSRTGILDSTHPTQARMATSLAFAVAPGLSTIDTATHMHKMEPAQNGMTLDPSAPATTGPVDFPPAILTTNMTADCQNIGHPPGMDSPSSLVADALGEWIFVADHNSNAVAVVSSTRRQDERYADPQRGIAGLVRVGARPTGIAVAGDLKHAYVHNALDGTISVIENSGGKLVVTATIPFATSGLPSDVERGRRLFYSAVDPRVTQPELGGVSCSSCHPNGRTDALSWTLPAAAQTNGWWNWQPTNLPVRNTPALWGVTKTAPYHWDGSAQDLSVFSTTMVQQMGGVGVTTADLSDLNAYMATLSPPDNPNAGAQASGLVARGQAIFAERCQSCHAGDMLTDDKTHQVVATDVSELDTPSLRGVFSTAPYLHDGSAATLRDVVRGSRPTVTEHDVRSLPEADVSALEAFLQAQ